MNSWLRKLAIFSARADAQRFNCEPAYARENSNELDSPLAKTQTCSVKDEGTMQGKLGFSHVKFANFKRDKCQRHTS